MKIFFCTLFFFSQSFFAFAQIRKDTVMLDSIFRYICEKEIKHADIVMKQVIMETGWLRSKFLMSKNNLFGFRKKYYMTFTNWRESVDYYKSWQEKYYKDDAESYENFLKRARYGSRKYVRYLSKINYERNCNCEENLPAIENECEELPENTQSLSVYE